jgi:hypothetical protein
MVRAEILDQIFNRVVTKATTPVNHYMGELNYFFHKCTLYFLLKVFIVQLNTEIYLFK